MVQLLITVGLMLGYFMCYGTVRVTSSFSWRFPLALQSGIAALLALASFFQLPQSPRWLAYKGRHAEATAAWDRLGVSGAEREKDSLLVAAPIDQAGASRRMPERIPLKQRWLQSMNRLTRVFGRDSRKQMFLAVFMMSMQQLSGIDGVLYVCTLQDKGLLPPAIISLGGNTTWKLANDRMVVRTTALPTGRSGFFQGFFPRIRRFGHPHLRNNHPGFPSH